MSYLEAILLGIVQGITEFLPISSDGHLMLAQHLLKMNVDEASNNVLVTVALHAGTLLSILVYFYKDLIAALQKPRLIQAVIIATLPLIPLGLFGKKIIDETLQTLPAAGIGFLITSVFLFLAARMKEGTRTLDEITPADALTVGLFQALAPAPGISRSGSTIFAGLTRGLTRDAAARFAFLIAVPAISGAIVLYSRKLLKGEGTLVQTGPLLVGTVLSFVVGLAAIKTLMTIVVRRKLGVFAWYCLILGVITLGCGLATGSPIFSTAPSTTSSEITSPATPLPETTTTPATP